MRIALTRTYSVLAFALALISGSQWTSVSAIIPATFFMLSLLFVSVAVVGRLWCSVYIAGNKNRLLVNEGPYSLCRNPLYLFSLIGLIGVGFATHTLTIPFLFGLSFLLYYPSVIRREEERLLRLFPEQFPAYRSSVPCFFPKTLRCSEPAMCEVNPKVFRRHMFSVIWFVVLAGLVELLSQLHAAGVLPVLVRLY